MNINIRLLTETAQIPSKATDQSAGYDLYADENVYIEPGKTVKISTGVSAEIPSGFYGGIYARSGLSIKGGLRPANCVGVIDSDYRGEIVVALHNDSEYLREVRQGDRIAQLIIQPHMVVEFNVIDELSLTDRGDGGFGHSGR